MSFHIGKLIEKKLEDAGMTQAEFGRQINRSRQTVYNILTRDTIDTELLLSISRALQYDFFAHYSIVLGNLVVSEQPSEYNSLRQRVKDLETILADMEREMKHVTSDLATHKKLVAVLLKANGMDADAGQGDA